ncbi:MAG: DMT family transporter [Bacteroidales bacterium]|nr:DMT family transporter [Bacteroidales bacterium]MBN2698917.1 DMT family transporter [Bacteroidales bacterium]
MKNSGQKGIIYASLTAFLWGFLAIALKVAVHELPPVTVVWFRFATAFIILSLWTFFFRREDFRVFKKPPWMLIAAGIFLGMNYLGFISGIEHVSPSAAQVFIQVGPVGFAVSGIIIFKEKINWKHIVGFIMVVSGILLFYTEKISELAYSENNFTAGMIMIIGGGMSWAVFASLQKNLVQNYPTNQLNLFIYGLCALLFLPFAFPGHFSSLYTGDWILLLFLGLNTVLAYGSLALAIKFTQATRVSVIITLNPIITFITMAILSRASVGWIEKETFSVLSIAGALTVLSGVITVIVAGNQNKMNKKRG